MGSMAARGRCSARSAGVVVLACSGASWVALATLFVSPSPTLPKGIRDRNVPGHQATFQTFGVEEPRPEAVQWASWIPAATLAVAFALVTASTPVRAEDNVQINVLSKEERLVAQKLQMIQESNSLASDYASRGRGEEGSVTPAKSTPAPEPEVP